MKKYYHNKYIKGLELQSIDDKGNDRINQQPTGEIILEEIKSKVKTNELR